MRHLKNYNYYLRERERDVRTKVIIISKQLKVEVTIILCLFAERLIRILNVIVVEMNKIKR